MEDPIRNFVAIDSIHGPFIINRHCALQAEALIKTGRPHLQGMLDVMMHVVDQLPEGSVLVDGGANAGLVCIPLARRVLDRGGQVHAFEPRRTTYYALCGTVALNQLENLTLHNMRLSQRNGAMIAGPLDGSAASSEIPAVRLDALGLDRLDFFRLDIGGMECDALRGARPLIALHLPWCWIAYGNTGTQAIMAEFEGLDYSFYAMDAHNMLCVPNARWNRYSLFMQGEPLVAPDVREPAALWNRALRHQLDCEWGHAMSLWHSLRGKGLDETDRLYELARCADFAGLTDTGLAAIRSIPVRKERGISHAAHLHLTESQLLLRAGRNAEAAEHRSICEQYMSSPVFAQLGFDADKHYDGQPLAEKKILVIAYGGAGDIIQYARYLAPLGQLGCTKITAVVFSTMVDLLRHNYPGIDFIAGDGQQPYSDELAHDYWCTFLTLATAFGWAARPPGISGAPYLACTADGLTHWHSWVGGARAPRKDFLLGLTWAGKAVTDAEFFRASSVRDFAALARMDGVQAFSLNRDAGSSGDADSSSVIFPGERIANFSDLAALTSCMDAVVTTCTAQVHLAGALGVPAVLLLSPKSDARWALGERSALYPGVRIVRATRVHQWDDAIDQAMALVSAMRRAPAT